MNLPVDRPIAMGQARHGMVEYLRPFDEYGVRKGGGEVQDRGMSRWVFGPPFWLRTRPIKGMSLVTFLIDGDA